MHEHELLCMTLELSGCYDQLDLSAFAGIELEARQLGVQPPPRVRYSLLDTEGLGHWRRNFCVQCNWWSSGRPSSEGIAKTASSASSPPPWADGVSVDRTSMLRRDWEYSGVCEPDRQTSRCTS